MNFLSLACPDQKTRTKILGVLYRHKRVADEFNRLGTLATLPLPNAKAVGDAVLPEVAEEDVGMPA